MAETIVAGPGESGERIVVVRDWKRRLLNELFALFIALLLLLAGGLVLLDTAPGHRFIVDQLAKVETASGLKFRIGRIDGRYSGRKARHVRVPPEGCPDLARIDVTAPAAWLNNTLSFDSITAGRVDLIRLPRLKPTGRKGPILPEFDIRIGKLQIDRLNVGPGVAGKARTGRVLGSADIRSGRALVDLKVALADGGDRINLKLDADPIATSSTSRPASPPPPTGWSRRCSGSSARWNSSPPAAAAGRAGAEWRRSISPTVERCASR